MHCQTDDPIPLQDTSLETAQFSLMDFPELTKKKAQQCKNNGTEKKVHAPIVPHDNDILLGRGGKNNMHVGNEKLRELARKVAQQYHRSSKKEKSFLSRTLVQNVREMDPPGRFLRRHPKDNHWEDMSDDEDKCREKCAQVLRDAVAFVGLKDAPPPSMARREQQLQPNPFSMRRNTLGMQRAHMQQPTMQMNPFAMSANTSSQILSHQQQMLAASGDMPTVAAARQFSFPNYNPSQVTRSQVTRHPLSPSTGSYDPLGLPVGPGYASMPQSVQQAIPQSIRTHPGLPPLHGDMRPPKRPRRMSNPFFDPFATMPGEAAFGYDRRLSVASNSYPVGSDFASHNMPGPRLATRRDSLLGNLSLGAHGSDHTTRSFDLFPDVGENDDSAMPKNGDSDEFASDFC